mmetsp:Transcript_87532/g.155254  ORF Transcript_87532/g.155254 Transcript_87532/m.155254 type:complete len:211 (-) Transcript_87532:6-638(-)
MLSVSHATPAEAASTRLNKRVPLVSTPEVAIEAAINFAKVGPDDIVCDLGCGLGGFCRAAARRGAHALGIDWDEANLQKARDKAEADGVGQLCTFQHRDFQAPDFDVPAEVTVMYMYLLPFALEILKPALLRAMDRGLRIVTFQFHPQYLEPVNITMFGALKLYRWGLPSMIPGRKEEEEEEADAEERIEEEEEDNSQITIEASFFETLD